MLAGWDIDLKRVRAASFHFRVPIPGTLWGKTTPNARGEGELKQKSKGLLLCSREGLVTRLSMGRIGGQMRLKGESSKKPTTADYERLRAILSCASDKNVGEDSGLNSEG